MTPAKIIKSTISNSKISSKNNKNYCLKSKICYENFKKYYLKQSKSHISSVSQHYYKNNKFSYKKSKVYK